MQDRAADRRLALLHRGHGADARTCVGVHVGVQRAQVAEGLVLAEDLHDRRQHEVRGARAVGVAEHDLVAIDRIDEILPAPRDRQLLLRHELGVVAEREDAAVDAGDAIARDLADAPRPVVQLRDVRRGIRLEQIFLGGLQERVRRTGPPHVAARIGTFRLDLRKQLARRLLHHRHVRSGLPLEADGHALAPCRVGRAAVQVELPLRQGRPAGHEQQHATKPAHDRADGAQAAEPQPMTGAHEDDA